MEDELRQWDKSCFLTLTIADDPREYSRDIYRRSFLEYTNTTFSDADIPGSGFVRRRDLQLFFKRLRKLGAKIKYYAVGEYGERSARAHYHVILFGLGGSDRDRVLLERAWPFGIVDIGRVEPASVRYVTGYVMKAPLGRLRLHAERTQAYPPFSVMSQGLGAKQGEARRHTITTQGVIRTNDGRGVPPPRYYINRLDPIGKQAFLVARRQRGLDQALSALDDGRSYVVNDKLDRAKVSRADFRARHQSRGTL